jgi:hypothetical protein
MSEEVQQPEQQPEQQQVQPQEQPAMEAHFPLMLTVKEIEAVLIGLRKTFSMESAEGLVNKIRAQATNAINAANKPQTGETTNV